jgi:hypothetical protein
MIHSPCFEAECIPKYGLKHVHALTEMHRESMSLYHFHICGIPRRLHDFWQIGLVLEGLRCNSPAEGHMKIARMLYLLAKTYLGIVVN